MKITIKRLTFEVALGYKSISIQFQICQIKFSTCQSLFYLSLNEYIYHLNHIMKFRFYLQIFFYDTLCLYPCTPS